MDEFFSASCSEFHFAFLQRPHLTWKFLIDSYHCFILELSSEMNTNFILQK